MIPRVEIYKKTDLSFHQTSVHGECEELALVVYHGDITPDSVNYTFRVSVRGMSVLGLTSYNKDFGNEDDAWSCFLMLMMMEEIKMSDLETLNMDLE